jgi:hypothetical protein
MGYQPLDIDLTFQSAPGVCRRVVGAPFQSAPPLRAATDGFQEAIRARIVSIRAALAGGDIREIRPRHVLVEFQSAPPLRAATHGNRQRGSPGAVSIRAALAGGDYRTFC